MNIDEIHAEIDTIYAASKALREDCAAAHAADYAATETMTERLRLKTPEQYSRDLRRDQINDDLNCIILKNQVCSAAHSYVVRETEEKRSALLDMQPDIMSQCLHLMHELVTTMKATEERFAEAAGKVDEDKKAIAGLERAVDEMERMEMMANLASSSTDD